MDLANAFIVRLKRGEGPVFGPLKRLARWLIAPSAFRIPSLFRPPLRLLYEAQNIVVMLWHTAWNVLIRNPLFQARCTSAGRGLVVDRLPFVSGHAAIHVGENVHLGGRFSINSGRQFDQPVLRIGDRTEIGWNVEITVSKEVVIEEDVLVAFNCRISDTDGHPRQADLRAQKAPALPRDVRPVRICRYAWLGAGVHVMKGVTIGEGAVIGANSVVISDIPAYSLALGNPAEVFFRNYGRPSNKTATS